MDSGPWASGWRRWRIGEARRGIHQPSGIRGKQLSEISWVRFWIGGFILAGLFVPAYLQTMNVITGGGLVPWNLVFDDISSSRHSSAVLLLRAR